MALAQWDRTSLDDLCGQALECEPQAMMLVCEIVAAHGLQVAGHMWSVLEDEEEAPSRRFRAAQILAQTAPPVDEPLLVRWARHADLLQEELVSQIMVDPQRFGPLVTLLQPASTAFIDLLARSREEQTAQSTIRTNLLVRFLRDSPDRLVQAATDSASWQLPLVLPDVEKQATEEIVPVLRDAISEVAASAQSPESRDRDARRVATAAALLASRGYAEEIWHLLRRDPLPATRAYMIHRFRPIGVPLEVLTQRLTTERDAGVRAAILLALGEYEEPADPLRFATLATVRSVYARDPDPGVHAAAFWLLRQWHDQLSMHEPALAIEGSPATAGWRMNSQGQTMIRIDARQDEGVNRLFEISAFEVSVEQYLRFRSTEYYQSTIAPHEKCPMNVITWYDAVAYCRWLSELEKRETSYPRAAETDKDWIHNADHLERTGYRLPTEAEWELACRAGSTALRFFGDGDQLLEEYAWYDRNSEIRSWPCGLLKPNDWGLFDIYGNSLEWCDDAGDTDRHQRVLRGGSYQWPASDLNSVQSDKALPATEWNSIGFRIARTIRVDGQNP